MLNTVTTRPATLPALTREQQEANWDAISPNAWGWSGRGAYARIGAVLDKTTGWLNVHCQFCTEHVVTFRVRTERERQIARANATLETMLDNDDVAIIDAHKGASVTRSEVFCAPCGSLLMQIEQEAQTAYDNTKAARMRQLWAEGWSGGQ
jgi:hypothetical protein